MVSLYIVCMVTSAAAFIGWHIGAAIADWLHR
jgi:hypothetical protein